MPWTCVIVASVATIFIGNYFGVDPVTLSVYTLFACWFSFIISYSDKWPLRKYSQPLQGALFLVVCIIYAFVQPYVQVNILNYGTENYWPIIANLFFALGLSAAFDNRLVKGLKQPKAVILNAFFWYLITIVLLLTIGYVPSIWFAFFVLYFFWFDRYPIGTMKQPFKGILSFVVMGASSLVLEFAFRLAGTSFVGGNLVGPVWFAHWVFWLVATSWVFKNYPFEKLRQPLKGIVGTAMTVALALCSFYITNNLAGLPLAENLGYAWVFVSWVYIWPIVFGSWPARDKEIKN